MKILVPTDGSVCALRALDYAINLDKLMGNTASISLLSVHDDTGLKHVRKHFPKGTIEDYLHDLSVKELKSSKSKLEKSSLDHEVIIKTGHVAGVIVKVAKSGKFDLIVMRILDAISALPVLILALLALAAVGGSSEIVTIFIIGFVFSPIIARTVRATVLGEAELDYVAAAKLRTEKTRHILFVEILPNVLPPIVVEFTIRLGYAVFAIATLSFLGVGVELGSPNWGSQVSENYVGIFSNIWWSTVFPAGAIATLAIGINLLADGIMESFEL